MPNQSQKLKNVRAFSHFSAPQMYLMMPVIWRMKRFLKTVFSYSIHFLLSTRMTFQAEELQELLELDFELG